MFMIGERNPLGIPGVGVTKMAKAGATSSHQPSKVILVGVEKGPMEFG